MKESNFYKPQWLIKLSLFKRFTVLLWVIFFIALIIKTALKPTSHSVFPVYYQAGLNWWLQADLYTLVPGLDYYRYSPSAAIFFSIFTNLGMLWGALIWNFCSVFIFVIGCNRFWNSIVLKTTFPPESSNGFFIIILFTALSGLWNSQCNAFVIGLILLGTADLFENKTLSSALFLAFAFIIKSTILPLLVLLVIARPFPLLPKLLLAIIVLFLLPFFTLPFNIVLTQYQSWYLHLINTQDGRWPGFRDAWFGIQTLKLQFSPIPFNEQVFTLPTNISYKIIQIIMGIGSAILVLRWKCRLIPPKNINSQADLYLRTLSIGMAWQLLFGPASEFPTYAFLAPFLGWAWTSRNYWVRGKPLIIIAIILIMILGWPNFSTPFKNLLPILLATLPLGTFCFATWLIFNTEKLILQKSTDSHF